MGVHVSLAVDGVARRRVEELLAAADRGTPVRVDEAPESHGRAVVLAVSESSTLFLLVQPENDDPQRGEDLALRVHSPAFARAIRDRLAGPRGA